MKRRRADELFMREFNEQYAKFISLKKEGKLIDEKFDSELMNEILPLEAPKDFIIENDDKFQSQKWDSLMKDCAFYYDIPTSEDKREIKKKLQFRYDSLFSSAWRAHINSRHDLMLWACKQRNEYLNQHEDIEKVQGCEDVTSLIDKYGPDYSSLKEKLGSFKGLFE